MKKKFVIFSCIGCLIIIFLASILFFACTFKISILAFLSGRLTVTCLSKRPGLNKAGSKTSGRLVAAGHAA